MHKRLNPSFLHIVFGLLTAMLMASVLEAQAKRVPHVDPALRALLRPEMQATLEKYAAARGRAPRQPLEGAVILDRAGVSGALRVGILIEAHSELAPRMLRNAGAEIGTVIRLGDDHMIITARVPLAVLEMLTTASELTRLEADHVMQVVNDSAMRSIGADQVRSRSAAGWAGTAGENVIVGVYDTGIDFSHQDFRNESGGTRLLGLWDQTQTGRTPVGFGYGNYCTPADIQAAIGGVTSQCTQRDSNGHGSHVAGIAAGDGSAGNTPFLYAGVAPLAGLLVVKGGDGSFATSQILDGLAFMSQTARALRRPAVVNLSLGSQDGPHDGSTVFERGIDNIARDSFVIVTTSGNDGSNANTPDPAAPVLLHASGQVATGDSLEVSFSVPTYTANSGACNDFTVIEFWGGSLGLLGADQHDIRLFRPDGTSVIAAANGREQSDAPNGALSVDQLSAPDPITGDRRAELSVSDCGASLGVPAPGVYRIRVKGRSVISGKPFHMWITHSQLGSTVSRGLTGFDNRFIVGSPGTARNVITVTAYTTRTGWPNGTPSGQSSYTYKEAVGDLARFSSGGPTRDGRQKPDIAAPGIAIMSTLSRDATTQANRIAPDGVHHINQGTSMAAPMVAGTIALMLQLRPEMDVEDVRTLLAQGAVQDAFTSRTYSSGGAPRDWWGAGKLSARNSVGLIAGANNPNAVASVQVTPRADTLVVNASVQVLVAAADINGAPVVRPITYSSSDPAVASVDANGRVTARREGTAYIIAQVETKRDSAAVQVVGPAALVLSGASIAPPSVLSIKGTRVPVLNLQLSVRGYEAIDVEALVFDVTGNDLDARIVVIRDDNRSGTIDGQEAAVGSANVRLGEGAQTRVTVPLTSVRVPRNDSLRFVVALEMSGTAPNASPFRVSLAARETQTRGSLSRVEDRIETSVVAIGTTPFTTSVLGADEIFALSENPVRSSRVIFNFSVRPTVAGVYTLSGRRVVDLLPDLSTEGRVAWNLENEQGTRVAPGVYLVVFNVSGRVVREKLIITRPISATGFQSRGF